MSSAPEASGGHRTLCYEPSKEAGMRAWSIERLGALGGVLFIVFTVVGNALAGSPPATDESAASITHFFATNHRDVVVGALLTSIAAPLFVTLIVALVLRLRALGQGAPAVAVFAFGRRGLTPGAAADPPLRT